MHEARKALRGRTISVVLAAALFAALAAAACGSDSAPSDSGTFAAGGASATSSSIAGATSSGAGIGGDIGFGGAGGKGPASDFPKNPVLDMPAGGAPLPPDIAAQFGPADSGSPTGGPCLVEPEPGTLFPNNWLRPRFRFAPAKGQNVFEIRIHAANELDDLLVYTTATTWTMPKSMWQALTANLVDMPMTVTIRGATLMNGMLADKPAAGTTGDLRIAPAGAAGAVVYWHTVPATNSGELKGFSAGDESVALVLAANQVQVKPQGNTVTCLGCHASTPDGKYAAFKTLSGTTGGALGSVEAMSTGAPPPFWSMASIQAMSPGSFGVPTFSKAHWKEGDYTLLTSWDNGSNAKLVWFDLQAKASGQGVAFDFLARNGDARGAIMPSWSHDGNSVLYTSTTQSVDGRPKASDTDLVIVPYSDRKGGDATPVPGASDAAFNEYYPAYAPDDQLIAFNRVPQGQDTYNQPNAEVFVIPSAGGAATRLAANDPIACGGATSPGVTNSWPKWAPEAVKVGDRTYYWLIFSSRRGGSVPQLYMTALVKQGGQLTTYPALYLWNQPADEANHTPAWDVFQIPPPPPPK